MSKKILERLFDSKARVKILKFLFRNMESIFDIEEMAERVQEQPALVRSEVKKLTEIGLLKVKNRETLKN